MFSQGTYYLYPFNIEYHILASTMLYVLWKNIGRKIEPRQQHKTSFKLQGKTVGTVLGLVVFTATIAIVVVYLFEIGRSKLKSELALTMYYLYAIVVLVLMCVAGFAGLLIYRLEEKSLDVSKNPARKLDADLLVGTASGSWLLSWGSILAIICAHSHPAYTWYNLPYSILVIIEKYLQNLFIIESIHCEHEKVDDAIRTLRIVTVSNGSMLSPSPSYKEIYNGTGDLGNTELPYRLNGAIRLPKSSGTGEDDEKSQSSQPVASSSTTDLLPCGRTFNSKRYILKNVAAFLFLCNLSVSYFTKQIPVIPVVLYWGWGEGHLAWQNVILILIMSIHQAVVQMHVQKLVQMLLTSILGLSLSPQTTKAETIILLYIEANGLLEGIHLKVYKPLKKPCSYVLILSLW